MSINYPATAEEYLQECEATKEYWASGVALIPTFRVREMLGHYFPDAPKPAPAEIIKDEDKPFAKEKIVAIRHSDFLQFGCYRCGCNVVLQKSGFGGLGTCEECGQRQLFFADDVKKSTTGFGDGNGPVYYPEVEDHPRAGTPWHPYTWPDPRPEGGGEYWNSRGIGYDLSGFVKSKAAGERLLEMVKEVLGVEKPKSWLDYRPNEPLWIQFKFQREEFNLEKLHFIVARNDRVVTKEILSRCISAEFIHRKLFQKNQEEHGCGYWSICDDRSCPCHNEAPVSQGFSEKIWQKMTTNRTDRED